jgi:hypothetical protein
MCSAFTVRHKTETSDRAQQNVALRYAIPGLNQGVLYFLSIMQLHGTPSMLFRVRPQGPTALPTAMLTKITLDRPL